MYSSSVHFGEMSVKRTFFVACAAFLLVGMHVFMQNQGGTGLELPVNSIAWMFASVVIGMGLWQAAERGELAFTRFQQWAWIGAAWMCVPLLYPGFPFKLFAVPRLLGLLGGLLFLLSLHQFALERRDRFAVLYLVLGALLIEAVVGAIQFFLLPIGLEWLHNGKAPVVYGIFQQVNVMGSFMATGLAIALYLAANEERFTGIKPLLVYASLVAAPFIILACRSRVALVGAVIAVACVVPALARRSPARLVACLACCALGVGLDLATVPPGFTHRIAEATGPRAVIWPYCLKLILAQPWLGYGYGGFESTYLWHYVEARRLDPSLPAPFEGLDHPHNEILYWGVEGGVAPLLGIAAAVVAFLWMVVRRLPWRSSLALLGLVAPFAAHTQTEFPFYQSAGCWMIFLFLVYEAEREAGSELIIPLVHSAAAHAAAVITPTLVIPFMLAAIQTAYWVARYERHQPPDPHVLETAWNPWALYRRYEMDLHQGRLVQALGGRDFPRLEEYVAWARRFDEHTPRWAFHHNTALALDALGRLAEATAARREQMRLYPAGPPAGTSKP
jgi:O-antigen polymerase